MSKIVKINSTDLRVIEYRGARVVTLAQVDEVHERPDGTAGRNFREHRARFAEGTDFFELDQPDEIRRLGFTRPQGGTPGKVLLITEAGYTMLVKPFNDDLAWDVQRKLVTSYFGDKAHAPLTQAEMLLASAQALVEMERKQIELQQDVARIESRVDDLAESRVWDHCPQNCEPITKIEKRMGERYALPPWVVDMVVRQLPLSPKPYGMVRNHREEAKGSQYAVYAVADITRIFERFISECLQESPARWSHRDIDRSFQMLPGGRRPKPLRAHRAHTKSAVEAL
ncbi:ORF6N domain-containing protein [Variovorax paradoxus]|nr:ORF6N domain-containing protein [Variovorax paradoxus]